ncbi:MAG: glucodextranase DOMON-like domain-containing protein [Spirochaetia bacterium]|nr:hypothetical protein [Spirochaetota bacterium]MDW8111712.1 glucodextranase DOMON-like domain-containing protein [Spirochaetia bacterium]
MRILILVMTILFVLALPVANLVYAQEETDEEAAGVAFQRPTPSMEGVRENPESAILKDNIIEKGTRPDQARIVLLDPVGDDKGPGYYTYPTHPVYVVGGFDIVKVEIDAMDDRNITFKITVNADLKQEWGMAADFDIQHFQIYIDQDRLPGSGYLRSIPGLNIYFPPDQGWEKAVIISPQPRARVEIEVNSKAKDMAQDVVIPRVIKGVGRTIIAVVSKKDIDLTPDKDVTKWGFQIFAQSNEGFPDPEDVLTRNVNEYRGLHRWGGGSDYWGDPEFVDIVVWPAKGTLKEAQDQFEILNVWESYPNPIQDVKAVVPMVYLDQTEQWKPPIGYYKFAKAISERLKPQAPPDKYVSGNFDLFGKLFTRWNWNYDATKENVIRNSLEIGIDGKVFTEVIDFYLRFELTDWEATKWTTWVNSTPGQVPIALQSRRVMLNRPLPTIDVVSIGNYDLNYSPWTLGQAWYPDRDKFLGLFVDGSIEGLLGYNFTIHYPLNWIGFEWGKGNNRIYDLVYGYRVVSSAIPGVKLQHTLGYYSDFEINPESGKGGAAKTMIYRGGNATTDGYIEVKLPLGFVVSVVGALSSVGVNPDFLELEKGLELDIDGNGLVGKLGQTGISPAFPTKTSALNIIGFGGTLLLKNDNLFDTGIGFAVQGFYIDPNYISFTAARGDDPLASAGFGGGTTGADVLIMNGWQSVHRAPQAADFVGSAPLQPVPSEFLVNDPVTGLNGIGWVNEKWEGIAALGWRGATARVDYSLDVLRIQAEGSYIAFGYDQESNTISVVPVNSNFLSTTLIPSGSTISFSVPYTQISKIRAMLLGTYKLSDILYGIDITPAVMLEMNSYPTVSGKGSFILEKIKFSGNTMFISPSLTFGIQWTKLFFMSVGYKYEIGSYTTTLNFAVGNIKAEDIQTKNYSRHRVIFTARADTPVGYYKWRAEIFQEGENKDFPSRAPFGAYSVLEWEYGF